MIGYTREEKIASYTALLQALTGVASEELTAEESRQRFIDQLVNIVSVTPGSFEETESRWKCSYDYIGSGVPLTADGWILTAYHCVDKIFPVLADLCEEIAVTNRITKTETLLHEWAKQHALIVNQKENCFSWDPTVYAFDPVHDLALVKAYIPLAVPAPISYRYRVCSDGLKLGDAITVIGLPKIYELYIREGNISCESVNELNSGDEDMFLADTQVVPGCSGGAVITSRGELAGITTFTVQGPDYYEHTGAAKIKYAQKLMMDFIAGKLYELRNSA